MARVVSSLTLKRMPIFMLTLSANWHIRPDDQLESNVEVTLDMLNEDRIMPSFPSQCALENQRAQQRAWSSSLVRFGLRVYPEGVHGEGSSYVAIDQAE
jgi:hypothetical protein